MTIGPMQADKGRDKYTWKRATTNQKHTISSQKPKRQQKHKIKGNNQTTKKKKGTMGKQNQPENKV